MAKQMTTDEESFLKRQARRRLIGAIALTTAVVIILPIVLDGEPPTTKASNIELRIPDKDKVADLQPAQPAQPVSAVVAVSAVAATVPTVSAPVATSSVLPVSAVIASSNMATVVTPHVQVTKIEPSKIEVAKPGKQESKPAANTKVETKTHAVHAAIPQTGFVVQVGAFANAVAAKKLQDKLLAQGLKAYTEKVGHNVRVRVGSFSTHEAADKVRHKIEAQGLHPNVVNLGS